MFTFSYAHAKCARISYPHKSLYAPPIHLMHTHMRECVYTCTLTPLHTYYQAHTHVHAHTHPFHVFTLPPPSPAELNVHAEQWERSSPVFPQAEPGQSPRLQLPSQTH